MDNSEAASPLRKRAPRYNAQYVRAAQHVVRPVTRQIGGWQVRVARLEGLSSRGQTDVLREQSLSLMQTMQSERHSLLHQLGALAPQIGSDGRVVDTVRALDTAINRLTRVIAQEEG
jgi:hypothetical protein